MAGLAEWQLTANVWIKGILNERHRVPLTSLSYRTGGLHQPGRVAKLAHDPPPGVHIEPIPPGNRQVMGTDFWTYGLAGNENTLRTFLRYAGEQGLISGQPDPAALFAPETLEAYII